MQPKIFRQLRADLASMWSPINKSGNLRRISAKSTAVIHFPECEEPEELDGENISMKVAILSAGCRCYVKFFKYFSDFVIE